ncbi:hypothetical protein Bpfe_014324, partial [Biomphalaria pfeifferi]
ECVILREFRSNQSLTETTTQSTLNARSTTQISKSSRFVPNDQRCCAIGQRVARKNMVCDITNLAVFRKWYNFSSPPSKKLRKKRTSKLSEKISVCSALFPKDFVLCCRHRDYSRQKKKCQKKPKQQREKCKQMMKKRFS